MAENPEKIKAMMAKGSPHKRSSKLEEELKKDIESLKLSPSLKRRDSSGPLFPALSVNKKNIILETDNSSQSSSENDCSSESCEEYFDIHNPKKKKKRYFNKS